MRPNSMPQKAPPGAPDLVVSCISWVFGFLCPVSQLTTAASCRLMTISPCSFSSFARATSAPYGVLNFHAVSVDMTILREMWADNCLTCAPLARSAGGRSRCLPAMPQLHIRPGRSHHLSRVIGIPPR